MANRADFRLGFPSDSELDRMFAAVPKLEKYKVGDKVTAAGGKVVAERAKTLAPRSTPETSGKWAPKTKQKRGGEMPLWKTIRVVTRKYGEGRGYSVVGPMWPEGNKAYFNTSPKGNKGYLWGTTGRQYSRRGKVYTAPTNRPRLQVRNWIIQAFDQTKSAQLSTMKAKLTELMDKVMRDK